MSHTTVTDTVVDGAGRPVYQATVRIFLVASASNPSTTLHPGYGPDGTIIAPVELTTNKLGQWSADLIPNSQITPANTHYQVWEGGSPSPIVVPASGGPYTVGEILATPPPTPSAPGITGVEVAVNGTIVSVRPELNLVAGSNVTISGADNPANKRVDVTINATGGGGSTTLPLFNVEDAQYAGGAKGDGTTDDYLAIRAAWDAMVANGEGYLYFPRAAVYLINADGRLQPGPADQYALFPIPAIQSNPTTPKRIFGVLGVGEANVIRNYGGLGIDVAPNVTASVLQVAYSTPFSWSANFGLPSVFGAPDADFQGAFTNVHFRVKHLIIRQEPNPSMCSMNLENCSTCHIVDMYCDVSGFLDESPEPTNPTGAALLLPKTGNAVQVKVDNFGAWGYYLGLPVTEHTDTLSAIIVRCKIGAGIRRPNSAHFAHISSLSMEETPWGIAGYDPTGAGPNLGVVAAPNYVVRVDFWDVEDFDVNGQQPWMYPGIAPLKAHVYDPNNALKGVAYYARVDSGVNHGDFESAYVTGGSGFSLMQLSNPAQPVTRIAGGSPSNPVVDPPNPPTIGTATAGNASASVTFTAANTGAAATSFTATSTPGSITANNTSSPIVVTGLTNGQAYTFTVHASNAAGDSSESAASNSVTPTGTGPTVRASDDFNRADNPSTLGTSSGGQTWTTGQGTWGISTNAAYCSADGTGGGGWNTAWLNAGVSDGIYTITVTPESGPIDLASIARVGDTDNYLLWDISGDTSSNPTGVQTKLFKRLAGALTGISDLATITMNPATAYTLQMVCAGTSVTCYINDVQILTSNDSNTLVTNTRFGMATSQGSADRGSRWDNLTVTDAS